jgi:flagellar operon protein
MENRINYHRLRQVPYQQQLPEKKQVHLSTFHHVFEKEIGSLNVSRHAQKRLDERNIKISAQKWEEIGTRLQDAQQKGIKDSLVIVEDAALVVNAVNKTVITAMDRSEAASQIFTNINGAIVMD